MTTQTSKSKTQIAAVGCKSSYYGLHSDSDIILARISASSSVAVSARGRFRRSDCHSGSRGIPFPNDRSKDELHVVFMAQVKNPRSLRLNFNIVGLTCLT
jgi:hypothetical protein